MGNSDLSVGIAFGGGGARGFAHIHAMEVLDEMGIKPIAISGVSIGAIMGAGYAAGMSGKEVREFATDAVGDWSSVASGFWRMRPTSFKEIISGTKRFGQIDLERALSAFLPEQIPGTFEELQTPLTIGATDYFAQAEIIYEKGDLRNAIAASAALPAVFKPITRDGRFLIDGSICNPVPYEHLKNKVDIIVAIDVVGGPEGSPEEIPSRIDIMFGSSQLMMQAIIRNKKRLFSPDIFISPNVSEFKVLDFLKVQEVLKASHGMRDELKFTLDKVLSGKPV